ncbi:hypothetical protein SASPL_114075 [Salvia splendens]|uniref:Wings apart-like protein C-terminal domain-containing protein n=1 Tax=Salvia splendens TaxID=180675 RepID=A0A8X9A0C7_SALSN|nr:hypothetical protein SASPL_114075 [Salvia splendens]
MVALTQRKGTDIGVFDFSEDVDLLKSNKCKIVGSDTFERSSSRDLGIPQSRKHGRNGLSMNLAEVCIKSQKKGRLKNRALEKKKKKRESRELGQGYTGLTATSMEIQEFTDTTEHIDEIARKVIDTILGISVDDTPSNLAAAALFYLLACYSQPIGSKLLGLCKNAGCSQNSTKETSSTPTEIMLMVRDILVNCKEIKPVDNIDGEKQEPCLQLKKLARPVLLLKVLKTLLELYRELRPTSKRNSESLGDLMQCLKWQGNVILCWRCETFVQEWLERSPSFALEPKSISGLESLVLLVKCLKIMENATFLSNDNQCHLLGMKGSIGGQQAPRSFTKLILSVIKILSGVSLLRSISHGSNLSGGHSSMESTSHDSFDQCDPRMISGQPRSTYSSVEATQASSQKWRVKSSQAGSSNGTSCNSNHATHVSRADSGVESSTRNRKPRFANSGIADPSVFHNNDSEPSKWESRDVSAVMIGHTDTSDFVSVSRQKSNNVEYHYSQETSCSSVGDEDKSNLLAECLLTAIKLLADNNIDMLFPLYYFKDNVVCFLYIYADLIVLMNLSNDNPEGCRQIASCGGLEILSSLIAGHFPAFSFPLPRSSRARNDSLPSKSSLTIYHCTNTPLTDQELDFLVAIFGLLVNLLEKDGGNRSRLAAVSVSLPRLVGLDLKKQSNMIPILCSIFLANPGTEDAAGEGKCLSWVRNLRMKNPYYKQRRKLKNDCRSLCCYSSCFSFNGKVDILFKKVRNTIAECLPGRNMRILVPVLERFVLQKMIFIEALERATFPFDEPYFGRNAQWFVGFADSSLPSVLVYIVLPEDLHHLTKLFRPCAGIPSDAKCDLAGDTFYCSQSHRIM